MSKAKKPSKPSKVQKKPAVKSAPAKAAAKPAKKVAAPAKAAKKAAPKKVAKPAPKKELTKKGATVAAKPTAEKPPKVLGKKAKKASGKEKEELEADEPLLDDNFGPDELAEYADEVEAATRDESEEEETAAVNASGSEVSEAAAGDEDVVLTDAEGRKYCRVKDCDQLAIVESYCRYHYLLLWKNIQVRKKILSEGKLERYVEELTSRYPDKYLDMLRKDLKTEKDFLVAIQELEIDESAVDAEFEDEAQNFLDEVRGVTPAGDTVREEEEF